MVSINVANSHPDLAKDTDVDLVVCSIKAPSHYAAIKPAIEAGKAIFVEWPLGRTASEAKELCELIKKHETKLAVVGLQGRFSPVVQKIKELVEGGTVGKVLSSTLTSQAQYGGSRVVKGFEYSTELEAGAGLVPIFFGHMVDMVQDGMFSTSCCSANEFEIK